MFCTLVLGLLAATTPASTPASTPAPRNVLLVLADDLGAEHVSWHPVGHAAANPAPTPVLAALAQQGVVYTGLWSSPQCSPARASILTGRHSFRHGIGDNIGSRAKVLRNGEITIADALAPSGYARGCFGKWHVSRGRRDPNRQGFEHFDGTIEGFKGTGYYDWKRTVNGVTTRETGYATSVVTDAAMEWIGAQEAAGRPWFAWVAYHAPHNPFQPPPLALNPITQARKTDPILTRYHGMIEALDSELGRLLSAVDPDTTLVLFAGDNGSPQAVAQPPVLPNKAKATAYQGGVRVPALVWGAGVPALGPVAGPVHAVDFFRTVLDAMRVPPPAVTLDSVSLIDPALAPAFHWLPTRETLFTERFQKNHAPPLGPHKLLARTLRDERFKLIRTANGDELYDLALDPWETENLLANTLAPQAATAYADLLQELTALVTSP